MASSWLFDHVDNQPTNPRRTCPPRCCATCGDPAVSHGALALLPPPPATGQPGPATAGLWAWAWAALYCFRCATAAPKRDAVGLRHQVCRLGPKAGPAAAAAADEERERRGLRLVSLSGPRGRRCSFCPQPATFAPPGHHGGGDPPEAERCAMHRREGDVEVAVGWRAFPLGLAGAGSHRQCAYPEGCLRFASWAVRDPGLLQIKASGGARADADSPTARAVGQLGFCLRHCPDGAEQVRPSRRCQFSGCNKRALACSSSDTWFLEGAEPPDSQARWCAKHAGPGSLELYVPRCEKVGCLTRPCFGSSLDAVQRRCFTHRLSTDVNVVGVQCQSPSGCKLRAVRTVQLLVKDRMEDSNTNLVYLRVCRTCSDPAK